MMLRLMRGSWGAWLLQVTISLAACLLMARITRRPRRASALARCRALTLPEEVRNPAVKRGGEIEAARWWEDNAFLLRAAWHEYGKLCPAAFEFDW